MSAPGKIRWSKSSTWKFFLYSLTGFLAVSIIGSIMFVWFMRGREQNHLDETFLQIDTIFTPAIVSSLWTTDYEAVRKQIQGLTGFHYIDRIEIEDEDGTFLSAGVEDHGSFERVSRDLVYSYRGETRKIGEMYLYVNSSHMWEEILSSALMTLLLELLLALVLSSVIAGAFYLTIGRHLTRFAGFLQRDDPSESDLSFSLGRKASRKDELALVVDHFNDMRKNMRRSILEIKEWRDLMSYIIRHDPNAIAVYDRNMRYVFVSQKYLQDYRLKGEDIIGKTCYEIFPDPPDKWRSVHSRVLSGEVVEKEEDVVIHPDGDKDYVNWQFHPLVGQDRSIDGVIYYGEIITERKEMERALYIEKEKFRTTLFSVGDAIIATDTEGRIVLMNWVAEELTGWRFGEAVGNPLESTFNILNEKTHMPCENPVERVLVTGEIVELDNHTILISKSGVSVPIEDSAAPILDQDGNITGVVLVFRDCTDKRKKQKEIEYLSYHDQLTGLYNRRFFDEELKRLDVERNLPLTLVMMDVNGLKLVNDAFGHNAGDRLLRSVAGVLTRSFRADDIIARIGGDEFAILLPGTSADQSGIVMERVSEAMAGEKVEKIPLSVSFGCSTKTREDQSVVKVLDLAEDRMYRNKISEKSSYRHRSVKLILQTLYATTPREQVHSRRVSEICVKIGEAMGLGSPEIKELGTAGMLHDIGKVAIDNNILDKEEPLDESEWEEIRRHPEVSYNILSSINEYASLAEVTLSHHEHWDGSGYPRGLKGENIPLHARIIAVADAYDAMTSERPYREDMSTSQAIEELRKCSKSQLDPDIVDLFIEKVLSSDGVLDIGRTDHE